MGNTLDRLLKYLALRLKGYMPRMEIEDMDKERMVRLTEGILENPMYHLIISRLEKKTVEDWKRGTTAEARELAWQQHQIVKKFDLELRRVLKDASYEAKIIEEAKQWQN